MASGMLYCFKENKLGNATTPDNIDKHLSGRNPKCLKVKRSAKKSIDTHHSLTTTEILKSLEIKLNQPELRGPQGFTVNDKMET